MNLPEEDLRDITFDKSAFGYRVDDVDDYVDKVTAAITALMQENDDLEEKLEVLAAKVAEYKKDEDSLNAAVLGAQKLGDSIVRESKLKAEGILRDATVRAERMIETAHKKVEIEQQNYTRIHKEVGEFRSSLMSMYKSHIELITTLPTGEEAAEKAEPKEEEAAVSPAEPAEQPAPMQEQPESEIVEEPVSTPAPEEVFEEEAPVVQPAATEPEEEVSETYQPHHRSKFGDLLFGDNVDF